MIKTHYKATYLRLLAGIGSAATIGIAATSVPTTALANDLDISFSAALNNSPINTLTGNVVITNYDVANYQALTISNITGTDNSGSQLPYAWEQTGGVNGDLYFGRLNTDGTDGGFVVILTGVRSQSTAFVQLNDEGFHTSIDGSAILTQVSAAPEPGTWALLLLGIGGVGAALRMSRRRTQAFATA